MFQLQTIIKPLIIIVKSRPPKKAEKIAKIKVILKSSNFYNKASFINNGKSQSLWTEFKEEIHI